MTEESKAYVTIELHEGQFLADLWHGPSLRERGGPPEPTPEEALRSLQVTGAEWRGDDRP